MKNYRHNQMINIDSFLNIGSQIRKKKEICDFQLKYNI